MRWSIWILVAAFPLLVACGSSGDDDVDDDDADNGTSDDSGASSGDSGSSDADIPDIKAGAYASGTVHIEITGDKDIEVDAEGGGIAQEGFALLTYQNDDASVQIAFSSAEGDAPGAVALTTSEIVTGGEWGKDCTVSLDQSDGEVRGEFSCDEVDALVPGSLDELHVKLKGTFTAEP